MSVVFAPGWLLQPKEALVIGRSRRAPAREQRFRKVVDLDADRLAGREGIAGLGPPERHGEVSTGTGGNRAEQVDLGQELEVVAFLGWAGFHEVAVICVESRDLEDVQDVVNV